MNQTTTDFDKAAKETQQVDEINEQELDQQLANIPPHSVLNVKCGWLPQQISMGNDARMLIASQFSVHPDAINIGSYKIFDYADRKCPHFKFLQELRGNHDKMGTVPKRFTTPQFSSHFKAELKDLISPQRLAGMHIIADNRIAEFESAWEEQWISLQGAANKFVDGFWDSERSEHVNVYDELREYHKNVSIKETQWPYVAKRFPSAKECRNRLLSTVYNLTPVSRAYDYAGMSKEVRTQLKGTLLEQYKTTCQQGLLLLTNDFTEVMKRISRATGQKSRFMRDPENLGLKQGEVIDLEYRTDNPEIPEGHVFVTYCKAKESEKREGYVRDGDPVKELWTIDKYNAHKPACTGEYAKLSPAVFRDLDEIFNRFPMIGDLLQDDGTVEELLSGAKEQFGVLGRSPEAIASYLKSNPNNRHQISDIAATFQQRGVEIKKRTNKSRRRRIKPAPGRKSANG